MAAVEFNISKGREVELYERVNANDPSTAGLELLVLAAGAGDGINGLVDFDTVDAILAAAYNEVTNVGYGREQLTDADLAAWAPDDTNNRVDLALPLVTFGSPNVNAGDLFDICVVAYVPSIGVSADSAKIPITAHEMRIDGTAIPGTGAAGIIFDLSDGWVTAL